MDTRAEIYALCCPNTGEVRYIGKANDSAKRLKSHLSDSVRRDTPLYRWIRSLHKDGKLPQIQILAKVEDWKKSEKRLIAEYRKNGARLLNVADGGDEPYCPPEVRAANGRKTAAMIHSDPSAHHIWEIKQVLGGMLKRGELSDARKERLRLAARKAPHIFGLWANI